MADVIERVEAYCLDLPYKKAVQFASLKESVGHYLLFRLVTRDGAEGLAECVCRPAQSGETAGQLSASLRYSISSSGRGGVEILRPPGQSLAATHS
jgi:hypothetical protein